MEKDLLQRAKELAFNEKRNASLTKSAIKKPLATIVERTLAVNKRIQEK